jgi:hypothetical protein
MSARRTKRPATVRPGKISDALHEKLSAASWKAHELRESEQPRVTGNLNARHIISDFLYSARGRAFDRPDIRTGAYVGRRRGA